MRHRRIAGPGAAGSLSGLCGSLLCLCHRLGELLSSAAERLALCLGIGKALRLGHHLLNLFLLLLGWALAVVHLLGHLLGHCLQLLLGLLISLGGLLHGLGHLLCLLLR